MSTVASCVVSVCVSEIANRGHTTAAEVIVWDACVPLICAVFVWAIVSLARGAKFRASWRVYEGTLFVVAALRLLGFAIDATKH